MQTKTYKKITDLEDLANELNNAVNGLEAVHDAMTGQVAKPECYLNAFYFISTTIRGYSDELTAAVNEAYRQALEELQNGKAD